jgi:TatD DNase family protein
VVHGFAGSLQQAERFVQLGYKIGVGGTITYPRASKTREVMARLPLSALLLETDAPDMPLNGFRDSRIGRNKRLGYFHLM